MLKFSYLFWILGTDYAQMIRHFKLHDSSLDEREDILSPKDLFEIKYVAPLQIRNLLLSTLSHYAEIPEKFSRAMIKSIYFDDKTSSSFYESRDGEIDKKKYRFRQYLGADEGAPYSLEVKIKSHNVTRKIKKLIYKRLPDDYGFTTYRDLIDFFERMHGYSLSTLRLELPEKELYPDTIILYERFRFDDYRNETRYNVDTNIMVCPNIKDSRNLQGFPLDHDILEIKTPRAEFFPTFLRDIGLEYCSFSKFIWGRETLM
jgi:hypothetical protein